MTEKNQNTINNTLMFQMHFQLAVLESYRLKSEEKYKFEAFKSNIVIENDTKYDTLYADQHKEPVFTL